MPLRFCIIVFSDAPLRPEQRSRVTFLAPPRHSLPGRRIFYPRSHPSSRCSIGFYGLPTSRACSCCESPVVIASKCTRQKVGRRRHQKLLRLGRWPSILDSELDDQTPSQHHLPPTASFCNRSLSTVPWQPQSAVHSFGRSHPSTFTDTLVLGRRPKIDSQPRDSFCNYNGTFFTAGAPSEPQLRAAVDSRPAPVGLLDRSYLAHRAAVCKLWPISTRYWKQHGVCW